MRHDAAFFPFCTPMQLPVIRYFNRLQNAYSLQHILSWAGTGLSGKDIATICNQPSTGILATEPNKGLDLNWDTLLVDVSVINNRFSSVDNAGLFRNFLEAGRHIVFVCNYANKIQSQFAQLFSEYPHQLTTLASEMSIQHDLVEGLYYRTLNVPVLLVGGLVEQSDSLNVVLALKESFEEHGHVVSCITGSNLGTLLGMHSYSYIFDKKNITEEEKILQLNQLARDIIRIERPELLIVAAPDSVIKYSNNVPNGFGIRTYMTSLATTPDSFVCCMPYDLVIEEFIVSLSHGIMARYGFSISAVHASNAIVDHLTNIQVQKMSCAYAESKAVSKALKDDRKLLSIPVFNLFDQQSDELYHHICNLLK